MGLDPALSQDGMFGHGTYVAEDAAKAGQVGEEGARVAGRGGLSFLVEGALGWGG